MVAQVLKLQLALEKLQLHEKQLTHKLELQTEMLNNKTEELQALNEQSHRSLTSEILEVQMNVVELEATKVLIHLSWSWIPGVVAVD